MGCGMRDTLVRQCQNDIVRKQRDFVLSALGRNALNWWISSNLFCQGFHNHGKYQWGQGTSLSGPIRYPEAPGEHPLCVDLSRGKRVQCQNCPLDQACQAKFFQDPGEIPPVNPVEGLLRVQSKELRRPPRAFGQM